MSTFTDQHSPTEAQRALLTARTHTRTHTHLTSQTAAANLALRQRERGEEKERERENPPPSQVNQTNELNQTGRHFQNSQKSARPSIYYMH